jgi:hypothetical protein
MGEDGSCDDDDAFKGEVGSSETGSEDSDRSTKTSKKKDEGKNKDEDKSPRTVLQFLKEEKEILTTVGFFIGGAVWLYAAFATKHYVGSVKCLLGATIQRIDNEAQSRQLQAESLDLNIQLRKLDSAGLAPIELITQSEALKQKIDDAKTRKQLADAEVKKASQRVQNGECEE